MKKSKLFTVGALVFALALGLVLTGCDDDGGGGNTAVTFSSVTANGSSSQTTTQLTLTFSQAITGLSASDITLSGVSGVNKGSLSGSGPSYTLPISGFSSGGTLSVAVAKSGYDISGSPKSTTIYYNSGSSGGGGNIAVTFSSVTANGSSSQTSTQLTLTFSQAITGLSAGDITLSGVSGVNKGTLGGSGPSYTLPISGFTSGGTLSVAVAKSGYTISGSPKTAAIYYNSGSNGGGGQENVVIILESNSPYGWQKTYEPASLLNGVKIEQGDVYTFTYSFISNVAIDQLQVSLVDNAEATGWAWNVISNSAVIQQNITANTVVSGSVTLTATGTATNATPEANRLVFQAGTGTASQPTLTFTTLRLEKGSSNPGGGGDTAVTFSSVTANGSSSQTSTQLTLTFSQAITGLSASNITLSGVPGVIKGTLSGSGSTYTLPISGFTSGGTLSVAVAKSGYTISGSPKQVTIYYSEGGGVTDNATLTSVTANGSITDRNPTTQLTLTFDKVINGLSANDINITPNNAYAMLNVNKGVLSGSGPVYTLDVGIRDDSTSGDVGFYIGSLTVDVTKSGYTISGTPMDTAIYYYSGSATATLISVTADGSNTQTTTQLTLTFDKVIDLSASHITLSGVPNVSKGNLSGGTWQPVYTLDISGITSDGTLTVAVESPGYTIVGSPKTVSIRHFDNNFTFISVGAFGSATQTSGLTLTFDRAIPGLTVSDITLSGMSGVTKGNLNGTGPSYTLSLNGLSTSGTLTVSVQKSGYTITGSPQSATVIYSNTPQGPSAPTGVSATAASSSSITVSWNSVPGADGYYIYRSSSSSGTYTQVGTSPTTSYTDTGLSASTTYYYKVAAYNNNGEGSQSSADYATTQSSGSGGGTTVTLSSVTANGSSSQTTTSLTLTFSQTITGLSASDITLSGVSGVSKGTLSSSGSSYTLPISGFTSGGTLSVSVSKSGYTINGSPKSTTIYYSGGGSTAAPIAPNDYSVYRNTSTSAVTTALTYSATDKSLADSYVYCYYVNDTLAFMYDNAPNPQSDIDVSVIAGTTGSNYLIVISDTYIYRTPGTYRIKVRIYSGSQYIDTIERTTTTLNIP